MPPPPAHHIRCLPGAPRQGPPTIWRRSKTRQGVRLGLNRTIGRLRQLGLFFQAQAAASGGVPPQRPAAAGWVGRGGRPDPSRPAAPAARGTPASAVQCSAVRCGAGERELLGRRPRPLRPDRVPHSGAHARAFWPAGARRRLQRPAVQVFATLGIRPAVTRPASPATPTVQGGSAGCRLAGVGAAGGGRQDAPSGEIISLSAGRRGGAG